MSDLYNYPEPVEYPNEITYKVFNKQQDKAIRQVLGYVGGGGAESLNELSNVIIASPQEGDVLMYDASLDLWYNDSTSSAPSEFYEYTSAYTASCSDPIIMRFPLYLLPSTGTGYLKACVGTLHASLYFLTSDNTHAFSSEVVISLGPTAVTVPEVLTNGSSLGIVSVLSTSDESTPTGVALYDLPNNTITVALDVPSDMNSGTVYGRVKYHGLRLLGFKDIIPPG